MSRIKSLFGVVLLFPGWFSVGASAAPESPRVLFVGNSFTVMNDLPQLTARLAASARSPRALETQFVGEGGATLQRLWETGEALEAIRQGKWDYVVLQEQGVLRAFRGITPGIGDPKLFHDYARRFDAEIKKAGARTVFFLTWARQDAPESQALLTNAYASIAGELKALVAPAGVAWQNVFKENPKFGLHYVDKSHPNAAGTYLSACVFYAVLFSGSPEGLSGSDLGAADAAFLQRISWQTAKDPELALASGKVVPVAESKPAAAAAEPATPAALERGRAILAAAQKAAGGLERLRGIKDVSTAASGKITAPQGQMPLESRETFVFPNVSRSEQQFMGRSAATFFDGKNGWRKVGPEVFDLPDSMKALVRAQGIRNTVNLLRAEGEFSVQFVEQEKVGETEADVILITKEGESVRLAVDRTSGTLLKKAYRGIGMGGLADIEEFFSDYREVAGLRLPFRIEINQNGSRFMEGTVNEVKPNTGVDPAELGKRPP